MTQEQSVADTMLADIYSKLVYVGSAFTVIANFTLGEIAAIVGIVATIATFAANLYFRVRADRREQHLFEKEIKKEEPTISNNP